MSNVFIYFLEIFTAWKVSVVGVILVRLFPHSDWKGATVTPNTDAFYVVNAATLSSSYLDRKELDIKNVRFKE